jgi:hypothetical protein
MLASTNDIITWLMAGDPAIRWQTMRDLLDAPGEEWQAEQRRTVERGWGAQLLALQDADGGWGGGIYSPKWTSATYTLLTLCSIGIPHDCAAALRGARLVLDSLLGVACDAEFQKKLTACDRCIVGMILQVAVYFGIDDERIETIVDHLLSERMPDGGWNCRRHRRPEPHHSSFHTTLNVLDGLHEYIVWCYGAHRNDALAAEQDAQELLLQHRLYKSDRTGDIINPKFTLFSLPYRWQYDVLRGLDSFARIGAPRDERLQDAIDLLHARRRQDGLWPVQHKYTGKVFFDIEKIGGPSRWNTLRALRILRWWEG